MFLVQFFKIKERISFFLSFNIFLYSLHIFSLISFISIAGPKTIQIEQRLPTQDGHFHGVNNDDSDSHPDMTISNNNRTWHSIELLDHYLHRHGSSTGSMKIASSSSSSTEAASFSSASITNNNHWTHAKKSFRLRSGYEFDFTCQTNGSLPDSQIFWYLRDINTNRLRNITEFRLVYCFFCHIRVKKKCLKI